jgi:hypothetical protein
MVVSWCWVRSKWLPGIGNSPVRAQFVSVFRDANLFHYVVIDKCGWAVRAARAGEMHATPLSARLPDVLKRRRPPCVPISRNELQDDSNQQREQPSSTDGWRVSLSLASRVTTPEVDEEFPQADWRVKICNNTALGAINNDFKTWWL